MKIKNNDLNQTNPNKQIEKQSAVLMLNLAICCVSPCFLSFPPSYNTPVSISPSPKKRFTPIGYWKGIFSQLSVRVT